MATKKSTPVQELAKAVNGTVKKTKRNERILVGGRTVAVVWTRRNGGVAIYAQGDLKPEGELKKLTEATSEGLRLKLTPEELAVGNGTGMRLARQLVATARDARAA